MDDNEQLVLDLENDPFSDAADIENIFSFEFGHSGLNRTKHKWAAKPKAHQGLSDDPLLQRFDVDGYVGKFWHVRLILNNICARSLSSCSLLWAIRS